jgi:regulation of enolase protein 1 (concanavalin A-like superfamily)
MKHPALALFVAFLPGIVWAAPPPRFKDMQFYQPGWEKPLDPDRDCKFLHDKNRLTITIPGADHDFNPARGQMNAPGVLRPIAGDFTLEARLQADFQVSSRSTAKGTDSHMASGFFVAMDNTNLTRVRIEFGVTHPNNKPRRYVALRMHHVYAQGGATSYFDEGYYRWPLPPNAKQAYLRLQRQGNQLQGYLSADNKEWMAMNSLGTADVPRQLKVGVIATTTSEHPLRVTFDQFKLTERITR